MERAGIYALYSCVYTRCIQQFNIVILLLRINYGAIGLHVLHDAIVLLLAKVFMDAFSTPYIQANRAGRDYFLRFICAKYTQLVCWPAFGAGCAIGFALAIPSS